MTSTKTIKLSDDNKITFTFYNDTLVIDIYTHDTYIQLSRNHDEFKTVINELKNDFNLTNHKIKLINYWYSKNYKKTFPALTYVTKYGRTVTQDQTHHLHQ